MRAFRGSSTTYGHEIDDEDDVDISRILEQYIERLKSICMYICIYMLMYVYMYI